MEIILLSYSHQDLALLRFCIVDLFFTTQTNVHIFFFDLIFFLASASGIKINARDERELSKDVTHGLGQQPTSTFLALLPTCPAYF